MDIKHSPVEAKMSYDMELSSLKRMYERKVGVTGQWAVHHRGLMDYKQTLVLLNVGLQWHLLSLLHISCD